MDKKEHVLVKEITFKEFDLSASMPSFKVASLIYSSLWIKVKSE